MEADWYVDPLGRYEGRYFDGNEWTDQVKEEGRLAVDPDWNRPSPDVANSGAKAAGSAVLGTSPSATRPKGNELAGANAASASHVDEVVDAEIVASRSARGGAPASLNDNLDQVEAEIVTPKFDRGSPKAVEPVIGGAFGARTAPIGSVGDTDFSSESPTRQVAVLGGGSARLGAGGNGFDLGGERRSRRWLYVLGAFALAVALAVVLLPRLFGGNDDVADPVDADNVAAQQDAGNTAEQADAAAAADDTQDTSEVELLPEADGDAPSDTEGPAAGDGVEDDSSTDSSGDQAASSDADRVLAGPDSIAVGGLEVLNGKPSLTDLTAWHRSSLGAAAAELPDDATCWFGRLGDAVVQNAHCGPVPASTPEEVRFDLVPLKFEDISEGVIQVRALTDAVVTDAALPNGLILVGPDGELDPGTFESAPVEETPVEEAPVEDEPAEPTTDEEPVSEEPATDEEPAESDRGGRGSRTVEDE